MNKVAYTLHNPSTYTNISILIIYILGVKLHTYTQYGRNEMNKVAYTIILHTYTNISILIIYICVSRLMA